MNNTNPFKEKKSIQDVLFFIMVLPAIFVMIAWNRFGCSELFEEKVPEPPLWDIQIAYFDPSPTGVRNPCNQELLQNLSGHWEKNFLTSVKLNIDEDIRFEDTTSRRIVEIFDPKEPPPPKAPLIPMVLDFYRIDTTMQIDGPSPKFVMVKKFKGEETTMVVVGVFSGHQNVFDWEHNLRTKYKGKTHNEVDTMYFNKKGVGSPGDTADIEKLVSLTKI